MAAGDACHPLITSFRRGSSRIATTGTDSIHGRFAGDLRELTMVERRKRRNTAAPKATRNSTAKPARRKAGSTRGKPAAGKAPAKRWSQRVTEQSDALDLKQGVFKLTDPKKIAAAEALGRTQFAAQGRRLSLGAFYAHLLCQPRRQGPAEGATRAAGAGQGRIEAGVREGVTADGVDRGLYTDTTSAKYRFGSCGRD